MVQHAPGLYRVAVAVIGPQAAADVTQDALLRAWTDLASLRDPDRFGAWLRRILLNRCRDVVRARRGVQVLSLDVAALPERRSVAPDPSAGIDRTADLQAALAGLSVDQRVLLALRYVADLPVRDVAQALDIPEGTVKSRLHAALGALRVTMGESGR